MVQPKPIKLFFKPEDVFVAGEIVALTAAMAHSRIHDPWWKHDDLKQQFDPPPIDRYWQWNDIGIEYEGRYLASEKVAVVAGEGDPVQGVMLISSEPVPCVHEPGKHGLFLERLFTAPWNRPDLRKDGQAYLLGVGTELLTWGAWYSREKGYGGRLLLDGGPAEIGWYQKRAIIYLTNPPVPINCGHERWTHLSGDSNRRGSLLF